MVVLARLAVCRSVQGRGIVVDAASAEARSFFLPMGFDPSPMDPDTLLIRLSDVGAGGTAAAARRVVAPPRWPGTAIAQFVAAAQGVGTVASAADALKVNLAHLALPRIHQATSCAGAGQALARQHRGRAVP
ncbi:protein of unknown function [Cyanobium sp. NIES-981]|nr:protein of unknown function [Cyanobium sp. NIES-981]